VSNKQKSKQNGELKREGTGIPQATQSSSVGSPSTSDTLGISVAIQSPKDSQRTPNSQENPNAIHARMIMAFVSKLGALVFWRKVKLGDGQTVYALCFPVSKWQLDGVSKTLTPR